MKFNIHILIFVLGMLLLPKMVHAQVDFNKTPHDDLGNVEDKFQEYFFEALKQKSIENYQRAVDALLRCEKLDDSKTIVYYELGKNYIALKNFGAAEEALKECVSREPENEWYLDELYEVYNLQNDTDKAIKTVKQLVKFHPDYRQDLAELYIKSKKYKEAIKILDDLDKEFGINEDRDYLRNQVYNITGQDDERIEKLEERLRDDPNNENNYLELIYRYSETGETKKAFDTARELLKVYPESSLVHLALYKFYLDKNETVKAIESMKIVLNSPEINADSKAKVFNDFVNYVAEHPEHESDLIEITSLVDSNKSTKTLMELAQYHLKLEDEPKALQYFEEALGQDPNNFNLLKDVLLLKLDLNQDQEVVDKTAEALEIFPAQPILYLMNGVANNKLGKSKEAIKSLETGLDYVIDETMKADYYTQLSLAYKLQNDTSKSQAFSKKAENILNKQQ